MLYKIENDFYVKVGGYFVKVEQVYADNDISLKPTDEKIEYNKDVVYEEVNFLSIKDELLAKYKKVDKKPEKVDEFKFDKKYSR